MFHGYSTQKTVDLFYIIECAIPKQWDQCKYCVSCYIVKGYMLVKKIEQQVLWTHFAEQPMANRGVPVLHNFNELDVMSTLEWVITPEINPPPRALRSPRIAVVIDDHKICCSIDNVVGQIIP